MESVINNIENFLKEKLNKTDDEIKKIKIEANNFKKNLIEYITQISNEKVDEDEIVKYFSEKYNLPILKIQELEIIEKKDYYAVFYDKTKQKYYIGIALPAFKNIIENKTELKEKYKDFEIGLIPYSFINNEDINEAGIKGHFLKIIKNAKEKNITDIHFRAKEFGAEVKVRLNGILIDYEKYNLEYARRFLKVVKNLTTDYTPGFDPEEMRETQDGRIEIDKLKVVLRMAYSPSIYNNLQNFTIRVISKEKSKIKGIEDLYKLGYFEDDANIIIKFNNYRNGLNLMSGATGSGKSKTFNTLLALIPQEKNILSAEDPVEYLLDNAVQHQVLEFIKKEAGQDKLVKIGFMEYMRTFMRQDPDVIFIGEWRKDPELTESIVYASETGHLVYTTLHSSRAINVPNLLITQYGLKPEDLSNNLNIVINQRLVRKLCPYCSKEHTVSKNEIDEIKEIIRFKDKDKLDELENQTLKKVGEGCEHCIITDDEGKILSKGYAGRTVIYEYLIFDDEVREKILQTTSTIEFENLIIKKCNENKAKTFTDIALRKVLTHQISLDELKEGLM